MKNTIIKSVATLMVFSCILSSCMEQHYYRQNRRHSPEYENRHRRVPVGVQLDLHN
jgi:hypothetical protein